MQRQELAEKIGIDSFVPGMDDACEAHTKFYRKYAAVAEKTLNRPLFQGFLGWMLTKECIEVDTISKIQVMIFPFQNGRGNWLAGKISGNGDIYIFPKKRESCRRLMQEFKKESVYFYIKARAMAALIHELLHLRYTDDEDTVRKKTEEYLQIFLRNGYAQDPKMHSILKVLFTARTVTAE